MFPITLLLLLSLPILALCAEDYYKLLNLDRGASDREIKKAYRTLSKKYHPDKNPGNESAHEKFVSIAEAYDVLSESETRKIYDQYGHEGVQQHKQGAGGARSHDPFDLFSRFFGGSGHFGHNAGQRRGPDMEVRISVPLRDFYNGAEHTFGLNKQHVCDACEGSGSADGKTETCSECGGRGAVVRKHMLAPGIFQQVQMGCDRCGGKGSVIKKPCPVCGGSRVVKREDSHTLIVERGMAKGAKVVYENEADESPDWEAGDLIINVMEKEPELDPHMSDEERVDGTFFRRKGRDLYWKELLSLREAWMGDWSRNLTHMDGHVVRLGRRRGEPVVQPGTVEVVPGEGMPVWLGEHEHVEEVGEFGNLLVEYVVVLPDQMEKGMEKDFHAVWEKWRRKNGVDLEKDLGRVTARIKDEL